MQFTPYLTFNGNCKEALERYAEIFAGEISAMMRFRDEESCAGMPDEIQDRIMHGQLKVGDGLLMASDDPTGNYHLPQSMHISVSLKTPDQAKQVFEKLADGGETLMPFGKTFFAEGFGMVRDQFGILWMVSVDNPESTYY